MSRLLRKMKVFIADDSEMVRESMIAMLSEIKEVTAFGQANDTIDAMEAITRFKPDIAILDIQMPYGSGIEVLRRIKARKLPVTVIMYTGYPVPQYVKKCMDEGADFFFSKPKDFGKLIGVITAMAKQKNDPGTPYDMPEKMTG